MLYIVTAIIDPPRKPANMLVNYGACPLVGLETQAIVGAEHFCSNRYGRHHSYVVEARDANDAGSTAQRHGIYVARVEEAMIA